jgi:hypothetical protein
MNLICFFFRQLCVLLNAEYIYLTFADIISTEIKNMKFASTIVRTLNMILLTTTELFDLRHSLRDISNKVTLFQKLKKLSPEWSLSEFFKMIASSSVMPVFHLTIRRIQHHCLNDCISAGHTVPYQH